MAKGCLRDGCVRDYGCGLRMSALRCVKRVCQVKCENYDTSMDRVETMSENLVRLYSYVKERGLEHAAHGVYVSPDTWTDAMYILHLRCRQAVFSHETALFFHDLTDREPLKYTITVRTGYNPSRLQEDGFQVYTIKKDLHETGVTTMQTPFGHSVPVYDMERTICDLLRSRNNIEMQVFQDALKQYAGRKDKNLRTLMKYASMFHVEKMLRPYLEVLL